jgi:protein-S-isoprenylcysteine O-methyltransferase Ste14
MDILAVKWTIWIVQVMVGLHGRNLSANSAVAFSLAKGLWTAFGIYWLISALRRKPVKEREPWHERLRHLLPMAIAFALVFRTDSHFAWLRVRFISGSVAMDIVGLWVTAAGVAFAIWARRHLGENWSAVVSIRSEHELIRAGPYRYVRHPIYTGMLLALVGTVLVLGEVRGLIGLGIAVVSFYLKASKEDVWLGREFGKNFEAHAKQTGMFLPRSGRAVGDAEK